MTFVENIFNSYQGGPYSQMVHITPNSPDLWNKSLGILHYEMDLYWNTETYVLFLFHNAVHV